MTPLLVFLWSIAIAGSVILLCLAAGFVCITYQTFFNPRYRL